MLRRARIFSAGTRPPSDGGVDAAGQLTQIVQHADQPAAHTGQLFAEVT
jgi:hypothetical protein